jgi:hypothetical protein
MQNELPPQTCTVGLLYANSANKIRNESTPTYLIVQPPKYGH